MSFCSDKDTNKNYINNSIQTELFYGPRVGLALSLTL